MAITTQNFLAVGVGASANDGTGDDLRTAFQKVNANFGWIGNTGFIAANIAAGTIEVSGNISASGYTGGNIRLTGNLDVASVNSTNLYGTIRTAAQTSITSIGTLTALTVNSTTSNAILAGTQSTGLVVIGGTAATGYINLGRSSSNHAIHIGNGSITGSAVKYITIGANGTSGSQTIIQLGSDVAGSRGNIQLESNVIINNYYVPTSNTAAGTPGQVVWDSGNIYVCVATDTWMRAALTSVF